MYEEDSHTPSIRQMTEKIKETEAQLRQLIARRNQLLDWWNSRKEMKTMEKFSIQSLPEIIVASHREVIPNYAAIGPMCYEKIGPEMQRLGDELSKIINLLHFVHDEMPHNGNHRAFAEMDAIDLYNYVKTTGEGVNCRQLAISLCEVYLSMGIPARYVTCMPADPNDGECHVINAVWSRQLQNWLWIDPTNDAWVMD